MKNNLKFKNNDKISLIKKYYKKNPIFLELILMNYEGFDLYIIINYIKKSNSYRLSWFNLSNIEDANVEKYLSCTYISSDVIELIKNENIILNIEAKTDNIHYDLEGDVINLIRKHNIEEKILISSFYHNTIRNFKNIDDNINYGALYWCEKDYANEQDIVEHAKKIGVYSINISTELANKDIVKKAHENNLKVFVYTVNTEKAMKDMIDYKVDGIFTDFPELMKEILK